MSMNIDPSRPLPPGYRWGSIWTDHESCTSGRFIVREYDHATVQATYDLFPSDDGDSFDEAFNRELKKGEYPS